jgi:cysteine desulfurase
VPAIVGLGEAARLALERLPLAEPRLKELRDLLHVKLDKAVSGLRLNGHPEHRLPNTLHVSFPGIAGRELLDRCAEDVAASLGSACHSHSDVVSGVLAAMGIDTERAMGAIRLSVGWMTTDEEIERAAAALVAAFESARKEKSPV